MYVYSDIDIVVGQQLFSYVIEYAIAIIILNRLKLKKIVSYAHNPFLNWMIKYGKTQIRGKKCILR